MASWSSFLQQFPVAYRPAITLFIEELIQEQGNDDYYSTAGLSFEQLAGTVAAVAKESTSGFAAAYAAYLGGFANEASNVTEFLNSLELVDRPAALASMKSYENYSVFKAAVAGGDLAVTLNALPSTDSFWHALAKSMWLRFREIDLATDRMAILGQEDTLLVDSITRLEQKQAYFTEWPTLDKRTLAKKIAQLPTPSLTDMLSTIAQQIADAALAVIEDGFTEEEAPAELLNRFGGDKRRLIEQAVTDATGAGNGGGFNVLTNASQTVTALQSQLTALGARAPFVQKWAAWLISTARQVLEQLATQTAPNVERPADFYRTITLQLQNPNHEPLAGWYLTVTPAVEQAFLVSRTYGPYQTQRLGLVTLTIPQKYNAGGEPIAQDVTVSVAYAVSLETPEEVAITIGVGQSEVVIPTTLSTPPLRPIPSFALADIAGLSAASSTTGVIAALGNQTTLTQIRQAGGLSRAILTGGLDPQSPFSNTTLTALRANPDAVRVLDAYATMSAFSDDMEAINRSISILQAKGMQNINNVTAISRTEFIQAYVALADANEEDVYLKAAGFYQRATVANALLRAQATLTQSAYASGYAQRVTSSQAPITRPPVLSPEVLSYLAEQRCGCEDKPTAVSPLAYLAALLEYATKHIQGAGSSENLIDSLQANLYQPFCELPITLEQMETPFCQTRLAVETLVRYLGAGNAVLDTETLQSYLTLVYEALLNSQGTSLSELQQTLASGDADKKRRLAERLSMTEGDMNLLLLNGGPTLQKLEQTFGFKNYLANPFTSGPAEKIAGTDVLIRWKLTGIHHRINTDADGFVYLEALEVATDDWRVRLYRNSAKQPADLVASGILTSARKGASLEYYAELYPEKNSGLSGNALFADASTSVHKPSACVYKLTAMPSLAAARARRLEAQWQAEDVRSITNPYLLARRTFPVIDPDLMGPDDMRAPISVNGSTKIGSSPYRLWASRLFWLESNLLDLSLTQMIAALKSAEGFSYPYPDAQTTPYKQVWDMVFVGTRLNTYFTIGSTGPDDDDLAIQRPSFDGGTPPPPPVVLNEIDPFFVLAYGYWRPDENQPTVWFLKNRKKFIEEVLLLTPAAADRLLELYTNYPPNSRNPISDAELTEGRNILLTALKKAFRGEWIDEEYDLEIYLEPQDFYSPIQEPQEGDWNQQPLLNSLGGETSTLPFIDPQLIPLTALPDPVWGAPLVSIWQQRAQELYRQEKNIVAAGNDADNGSRWEQMTGVVYTGSNELGVLLSNSGFSLESLADAIVETGHTDHAAAITFAGEALYLTPEEAVLVFTTFQKANTPLLKVLEAEWLALAAVLTHAWKRLVAYPQWQTVANNKPEYDYALVSGFPTIVPDAAYALMYKQRLVKWRATADQRRLWTEALASWWQAPLIDPDLLGPGDFRTPRLPTATEPGDPAYTLFAYRKRDVEGWISTWNAQNSLNTLLGQVVEAGLTLNKLDQLLALHQGGADISKRLLQLDLTATTLEYIVKNPSNLPQIRQILAQVKKTRLSGAWKKAESDNQITLTSQYFVKAYDRASEQNQYLDELLKPWRSSRAARRAWQDKLDVRNQQYHAAVAGLQATIYAIDEQTSGFLRDALIEKKVGITGANSLTEKAEALGKRLLIDFQVNCCQDTTRVSLMIEVMQKLYLRLRNQSLTELPSWSLTGSSDQDWEWLSSYERWRSLMFVYLYPENVLMPTIRPVQTNKFRELSQAIRDTPRFSFADGLAMLGEYEKYLNDVTNLTLVAAVRTEANLLQSDALGSQVMCSFNFASAPSGLLYYNLFAGEQRPNAESNIQWRQVPGLQNIVQVVGAAPHKTEENERFIYVFIVKAEGSFSANGRNSYYGKNKISAQRLNLRTLQWDNEPIEVPTSLAYEYDETHGIIREAISWDESECLKHSELCLAERAQEADPLVICGKIILGQTKIVGGRFYVLSGFLWSLVFEKNITSGTFTMVHGIPTDNSMIKCYVSRNKVYFLIQVNVLVSGNYPTLNIRMHFIRHEMRAESINTKILLDEYIRVGTLTGKFFVGPVFVSIAGVNRNSYSDFDKFDIGKAIQTGGLKCYFLGSVPLDNDGCRHKIYFKSLSSIDIIQVEFDFYTLNVISSSNLTRKISFWFASNVTQNDKDEATESAARGGNLLTFDSIGDPGLQSLTPVVGTQNTGVFQIRGRVVSGDFLSIFPFVEYSGGFAVSTNVFALSRLQLSSGVTKREIEVLYGTKNLNITINSINKTSISLGADGNTTARLDQLSDTLSAIFGVPILTTSNDPEWTGSQIQFALALPLTEAYYYLPLMIAMKLHANSLQQDALRFYNLIYDHRPGQNNVIYPWLRLTMNDSAPDVYAWLDNLTNPHSLARLAKDRKCHEIYVTSLIAQCLIAFADQEYTRDTVESVSRAREYYVQALDLLNKQILTTTDPTCEEIAARLEPFVTNPTWRPEWLRLKKRLIGLDNRDAITGIVSATHWPINNSSSWETRMKELDEAITAEYAKAYGYNISLCYVAQDQIDAANISDGGVVLGERQLVQAAEYAAEAFQASIREVSAATGQSNYEWLVAEVADQGTAQRPDANGFVTETTVLDPLAALSRNGVIGGVSYLPTNLYFCVPRNPLAFYLRLYVEVNLFKMRSCRNIAGMQRELDPYAAPTDATSGLPMLGVAGQLLGATNLAVPPTAYRFSVLLERTRQLVSLAQQTEASLLSTLEKRDAERYQLLKARQEIALTKQSVRLQDLKIKEAQNGVKLSQLQQEKNEIARDQYQEWIEAGMNEYEQKVLDTLRVQLNANIVSLSAGAAFQGLDFASSAIVGTSWNTKVAVAWIAEVMLAGKLTADIISAVAGNKIQENTIRGSFQRTVDQWNFQKNLANQDIKIGAQQIKISEDRVRITNQEKRIAELQVDHAQDTLNFLQTKFTNAELYDWMSGVLERAYSYFLQQATAMAKTAEQQLAFERQEAPVGMIQPDYWAPAVDQANAAVGTDATPTTDRKGLTGSVRLLQDVTRLEQHAFQTNKRRLQLTKTLSLATLLPIEFAFFRRTGRLPFTTLASWFDRDFPGHYHRIIRRVRVAVVALAPPNDGMKARLQTTGLSTAVLGSTIFREVRIPRQPESVSYSLPGNAYGLFELEQQPGEMLYPFEGMGVTAAWEFSMEPGANWMDYQTIADVLITFEYTALDSYDYRQILLKQGSLNEPATVARAFSLKNDFPDQWYDLHHPLDNAATGVTLPVQATDWPANIRDQKITALTMVIDGKPELPGASYNADGTLQLPPLGVALSFTTGGANGVGIPGGLSISNGAGIISTKANAATALGTAFGQSVATNWIGFNTKSPVGTWQFVPDTALREALQNEQINDILFIIQVEGDAPGYHS